MDPRLKLIFTAAIIILPGLLFYFLTYLRFTHRIQRAPGYLIKDLPSHGRVIVTGSAERNNLISPLTKKDCVYFNSYVQEFRYIGVGDDPAQVTVYKNTSKNPLVISDETGSVQVDPNKANIILGTDFQDRVIADTNLEIRSKLIELGLETTDSQGKKKSFWVHEEYISAGEPICIVGEARKVDGQNIITHSWNHRLIISDYDKAGLVKIYHNLVHQELKFIPIFLLGSILILLSGILLCKWPVF